MSCCLVIRLQNDATGLYAHLTGIPKALLPGVGGKKILDFWWEAVNTCVSEVCMEPDKSWVLVGTHSGTRKCTSSCKNKSCIFWIRVLHFVHAAFEMLSFFFLGGNCSVRFTWSPTQTSKYCPSFIPMLQPRFRTGCFQNKAVKTHPPLACY